MVASPKYPQALYIIFFEPFRWIANKIGPNRDNNGTLQLTSFFSQRKLFIMTLNKDFIHSPVIMYFPLQYFMKDLTQNSFKIQVN